MARLAENVYSPDTAAVLAMASQLNARGHSPAYVGQISGTYQGADEFMRQCMRVAQEFENWACVHVDFETLGECWPYFVEETFVPSLEKATGGMLGLAGISYKDYAKIAALMGLPAQPRRSGKHPMRWTVKLRLIFWRRQLREAQNLSEQLRADYARRPDSIAWQIFMDANSNVLRIQDRIHQLEALI